jgi:pyruvate ferredoxin oxidoreductase gamma subunit
MQEIIIIGRGGQGAQTAGNLLARAFYEQGQQVQTFATYGGARRGTAVISSLRVDDKPIRLRCNIEKASAMLCFDDSLLDESILQSAGSETKILVNTKRSSAVFEDMGDYQFVSFDGNAIAQRNEMGKVVNSALLGAFIALIGEPNLEIMCQIIEQNAPVKIQQNIASCRESYQLMHFDK